MEVATSTVWVQCKIRYCARALFLFLKSPWRLLACLGQQVGTMPAVVATVLYRVRFLDSQEDGTASRPDAARLPTNRLVGRAGRLRPYDLPTVASSLAGRKGRGEEDYTRQRSPSPP